MSANPDLYYNKALKAYNTWYKFIDNDYYYETAIDNFEKAKSLYIVQKRPQVSSCFEYIIKCYQHIKNDDVEILIAIAYNNFADYCYNNKSDVNQIIDLYKNAQVNYINGGNMEKYISLSEKIADIYCDIHNLPDALKYYDIVVENCANNKYKCIKAYDKIIDIHIKMENYKNALDTLKELIKLYSTETYIQQKLSYKIFQAICCDLLIDDSNNMQHVKDMIFDYQLKYPRFDRTEYYKFVVKLVDILDKFEESEFDALLNEHNAFLEKDDRNLLSKIKDKYQNVSLC